jgi:hypothetical protein
MTQKVRLNFIAKLVLYWVLFLFLHYSYEWLPVFPLNMISGASEAFFQHQKIAFYAYLLVNLIEVILYRRNIADKESYVYARLFSTLFIPWAVFLLWYVAPAVYGRLPSIVLEILYANMIVLFTGFVTIIIERSMEKIDYSKSLKFVVVTLFFISILLYVAFSYRLPWADVFTEPDWRP